MVKSFGEVVLTFIMVDWKVLLNTRFVTLGKDARVDRF